MNDLGEDLDFAFDPAYVPTGPNNRINPYYQKINNVRLARVDYNRTEFFGTIGGVVPAEPVLRFEYLGQDTRAPRIPFTPAAFAAAGGVPPYIFTAGDGTQPVVIQSPATVGRYYYSENGTYTARLISSDFQSSEVEAVVDWIVEPPAELVLTPVPSSSPDLWGIMIEGSDPPFHVDWGDGVTTQEPDRFAQHRYAESGIWPITATDANGVQGMTTVEATVEAPPPNYVYNGNLTVGSLLTRKGFLSGDFGALSPREWEIYKIDDLYLDKVSDEQIIVRVGMFSNLPIYDSQQLRITFADQPPITADWNGSFYTTTYAGSTSPEALALANWLATQVGATVPVKVEGFIVQGPFVSAGITYWLRGTRATPEIGFNIDSDIDPDIWLDATTQPRGIPPFAWPLIRAKIEEVLGD